MQKRFFALKLCMKELFCGVNDMYLINVERIKESWKSAAATIVREESRGKKGCLREVRQRKEERWILMKTESLLQERNPVCVD